MRKDWNNTRDGQRFKKGDKVKCTYNYGIKYPHPLLGEVYEVVDCYWHGETEFIDIKTTFESKRALWMAGGWFVDNFTLYRPFIYRSKKEVPPKPRFMNHRHIVLGS